MAQLKVDRPRPRHLSDPHHEFYGTGPVHLLAIPDAKLEWHHYKDLLGPHSPAGTYEEVVYFLPLAVDYLISHDDSALDLVTTPVWFVSEYNEELRHDRLRQAACQRISDCLAHWTREFRIIHFDLDACREKGWNLHYNDYVQFNEVVCQCTEDLHRFKTHADIALGFFQSLSNHACDPVKAAWFLEMARACDDVYMPPDDPEIRRLLSDHDLLINAASLVRNKRFGFEMSPTYWDDLFSALNI